MKKSLIYRLLKGCRFGLLVILLFYTSTVTAQTTIRQINEALQRAAGFESQKDLARAISIYRNLHQKHPKRVDILMRFEAALSRAGLHAEAVTLLHKRLADRPNDVAIRLRIGHAFFALGQPDSAAAHWDLILKDATSPNPFALVADRYRKRNLDRLAAQTYRRARTDLRDFTLFARELAEIAERQTRYSEAVQEYLIFLKKNPQYLGMVEGRLRDFAKNGDQQTEILHLLSADLSLKDLTQLSLLIEYALPAGFASQALELLLTFTKLPPNGWTYLSKIARYSLENRDPNTAILGYEALHNQVERPDLRARAQLGLGRAYELNNQPPQAQTHYNTLIKTYPKRPEADEARFRLGVILRDHHNDAAQAQKTFQNLINTKRRSTWRYKALFELAEGYLQASSEDASKLAWQQIITERRSAPEGVEAQFRLAQFRFLRGQFGAAQALLDTLLKSDVNRDIINDAIALSALLQEGQRADSTMLATYAQANLKLRQKDHQTAFSTFEQLYKKAPQSYLADRLLNHQAQIHENNRRYSQAIHLYRKLVATLPWSPFCPAACIAQANIFDTHLKQYYEAQKTYETLLIDYPLSLEADIARERLRALQRKIQDLESNKEAG